MHPLKLPKLIFIVTGLILLNSALVIPQSFNVTHYNEQSGLCNSAVWSVAQDGEHNIWFGTRSGLSVYDGIKWRTYDYLIEKPVPTI
jgi:hypothetical protein